MNLFDEIITDSMNRIAEIKAMSKFAIVNNMGEMINPTDYGYEVGFYSDWTWDINELDEAVDLCVWMSEKWNNEMYIVPCANIDEGVF